MRDADILPFRDYEAARRGAALSRRGDTLYPRLVVLDNRWFSQSEPGAELCALSPAEAALLCEVA